MGSGKPEEMEVLGAATGCKLTLYLQVPPEESGEKGRVAVVLGAPLPRAGRGGAGG